MLFEELKVERDINPIVLIDNSGSTGSQMNHNKLSILNNEKIIASKIFKQHAIENVYLMFLG